MLNTALTIILDEHRSMAAVTHGLRFLVREMREKGTEPDSKLLWAMLYYIDTFPQKLHHPKEEAYLFRRLKMRTRVADKAIMELEEQHRAVECRQAPAERALHQQHRRRTVLEHQRES